MARNALGSETKHPKAIRSNSHNGKGPSIAAAKRIFADYATTPVPPAPELLELYQELIANRQQSKHAQHQIEILVERNTSLQHELIELAHKERQARHLAYHDGLTGLPNRSLLQDRFHQAMSQAQRHHKPLALLMLDLDEFKQVNDKLGHASGDKLLQAVARRLAKSIRGADTACRYGGDEFAIMLAEIDGPNSATALAAEIGRRLSEPYIIDGYKIQIAVSRGVAVYPGDGQTFDDLMKQADSAMYRTKSTGHDTVITELPQERLDSEGNAPGAPGIGKRDPPAPRRKTPRNPSPGLSKSSRNVQN